MHTVRQPAVAGLFYPSNADQLASDISQFLLASHPLDKLPPPKAFIVPHAGYAYSGSVAAEAYAQLNSYRRHIKQVIILGPAHRVALQGLAIMDVQYFRTPLGDIAQDNRLCEELLELPQVNVLDQAHWQEHSLEVQLPFLQTVLEDFSVVALAVGDSTASEIEQVLNKVWGGPETLIVISSDLSHYKDYQTATYVDRSTCEAIEKLDIEHIDYQQACGCVGVKGLLRAARRRDMQVTTLALCNSGDRGGDKEHVVGYGSWAFSEPLIKNE